MNKLGAGRFPRGKLNEDDEGELTLGIARDPDTGYVHIRFGVPIEWIAFPPEEAIEFAKKILEKARGN